MSLKLHVRIYARASRFDLDRPMVSNAVCFTGDFPYDSYSEDPKCALLGSVTCTLQPATWATVLVALKGEMEDELLKAQVEAKAQIANVEAALRNLPAPATAPEGEHHAP